MSYTNRIFNDISEKSAQVPNKEAIVFEEKSIRFSELELYSNKLAHYLLSQVVVDISNRGEHSHRVAIFLDNDVMLPVVILAVMKAGLTYIPLSSFQPAYRINQILEDSQASLIITTTALSNRYALSTTNRTILTMNDIEAFTKKECEFNGSSRIEKEDNSVAYVLYTSGSTGTPKGVEVEHSSLAYYLNWFNTQMWSKTKAILPLTSSLSFAASLTQLFSPLLRGDTLHILPTGILNNPKTLLEWYQDKPNAALYCVPTVWNELLEYRQSFDRELALPSTLYLSGEPIPERLKERTFLDVQGVRIFNLYGPTETVANCSFSELYHDQPITLGKALEGSRLFLLDKQGEQIVQEGDVGEICVSGPGVARGYLNRPALNEKQFFLDNEEKVYKTGDLGQFDEHGDLLYLGRKDRQIKHHGVRVELGDIEANLLAHPDVIATIVLFIDDSIVAYLLAKRALLASELRTFLQERCFGVSIPSQFILLESFPKLPNGKLDQSRLPIPMPTRPDMVSEYQAAANDVEQDLIDIWQEVLGFRGLGAEDDFFELGGNSLQAMRARTLIRKRLYSDIDFNVFFHNTTPRQLARVVPYYSGDEESWGQSNAISVSNAAEETAFSDLSSQQTYFLTLDQTSSNPDAYQISFLINMKGQVDVSGIEWSLSKVLAANPVLRSQFDLDTFTVKEGGFGFEDIHIEKRDYKRLGIQSEGLTAKEIVEMASLPAFDLEHTPAICIAILTFPNDFYYVAVRVHHTVFDHDSIGLFYQQFLQRYQDYMAGDIGHKVTTKNTYRAYAHWQQTFLATQNQKSWSFWLGALDEYVKGGADASEVGMKALPSGKGVSITLTSQFSQSIRHFAHRHNTTPYVVLLALFNRVLNAETRYRNMTIGLPVSNRALYQDDSLIGCFVNMMTYFHPTKQNETVMEQLDNCRSHIYEMMEHQSLPYQDITTEIRKKGWMESLQSPVIFNYLSNMRLSTNIGSCQCDVTPITEYFGRCDLTLTVEDYPEFILNFDYEKDAFSKKDVSLLAESYLAMITQLIEEELQTVIR